MASLSIRKLDEEQKRQILDYIQVVEKPKSSLAAWLDEIDLLREELTAKYGKLHFPSAVDMINEMREERDNDILNSL